MLCDDGSETDDSFSGDDDESTKSAPRLPSISGGPDSSLIPMSSDGSITPATADEGTSMDQSEEAKRSDKNEDKEGSKKKETKAKDGKESVEDESPAEDRGDPEMAPIYLQRLLPIFTEIYHSSLAPALRKESLRLMRKMCRYIASKCLQDLCEEAPPTDPAHPFFSAQISEVLASVLESEDDHESHLSALHIMQDLLAKNREAFDEQFVRLGLPNKIASLAGPLENGGVSEEGRTVGEAEEVKVEIGGAASTEPKDVSKDTAKPDSEEGVQKEEVKMVLEDATDIVVTVPYQWRDWCVIRSRDCLYLWNEYCVIELSNVSNGWFRFLVDNRLATMYSSGSTEGGPDSYGELGVGGWGIGKRRD